MYRMCVAIREVSSFHVMYRSWDLKMCQVSSFQEVYSLQLGVV